MTCNLAVKLLWTTVLSLETKEIVWKGAAFSPDTVLEQVLMIVPSLHSEYMLIVSEELTVGGVIILVTVNEKAVSIVEVMPVTVNWAWLES